MRARSIFVFMFGVFQALPLLSQRMVGSAESGLPLYPEPIYISDVPHDIEPLCMALRRVCVDVSACEPAQAVFSGLQNDIHFFMLIISIVDSSGQIICNSDVPSDFNYARTAAASVDVMEADTEKMWSINIVRSLKGARDYLWAMHGNKFALQMPRLPDSDAAKNSRENCNNPCGNFQGVAKEEVRPSFVILLVAVMLVVGFATYGYLSYLNKKY